MRIVVLEDDEIWAGILQDALESEFSSVELRVVSSEQEFRDQFNDLAEIPPDLVFVDVMLRWSPVGGPHGDVPEEVMKEGHYRGGIRCLRILRGDERTRAVPVIVHSVLTHRDVKELDEFASPSLLNLPKGEPIDDILRAVRSLVPGGGDGSSHDRKANQTRESAPVEDDESTRDTIVVTAALYEELDRMFDARSASRFPIKLHWSRHLLDALRLNYWRAQLTESYDLIAVTPDSMGLTETAIVATTAFLAFKPRLSAMIGICAGRHGMGVRLGHIIVPNQAFHYQFGKMEKPGLKPEIRAETVDPHLYTSAQRIGGHEDFEQWMSEGHASSMSPEARCRCHVGPIASSDFVANWKALVEQAADMDRKVVGLDMESYAFLRAAKLCGLSQESFVVKCVTDYADKKEDDPRIREWAQVSAARFFYFMLARWLDDREKTNLWDRVAGR